MTTDAERVALLTQAEAWLADDPDPATRDELRAVIDAARTGDGSATGQRSSSASMPVTTRTSSPGTPQPS